MADTLKSFLVSIGFNVDATGQAKAMAAVQKAEATITKATQDELEKRRRAEDQAWAERIEAAVQGGKELTAEEKAAAERITKVQKAEEEKREKDKLDRAKAEKDRQKRVQDAWAKANKDRVDGILAIRNAAIKATVAVAAADAGLVALVDRAAKGFERLNYLSARAGSSATNTSAFGYAAGQLGSSPDVAQASLKAFGIKLKNYAGFRQSLQNQVGNIYGPDGKLQDSGELATRLGERLRQIRDTQGPAQAAAWASSFGFDDDQLQQAMMSPEYRAREAQFVGDQGKVGADPNAAASAGTEFEKSLRHLQEVVASVGTAIETKLAESLKPQLDALSKWVQDHGKDITDISTAFVAGVTKLVSSLVNSDGFQAAIESLNGGLHTFADYVKSDGFRKDVKAFVADIAALAHAIRSALEWLGVLPSNTPSIAPDRVVPGNADSLDSSLVPFSKQAYRGRADVPDSTRDKAAAKLAGFNRDGNASGTAGPSDTTMDQRAMAAMRYLVEKKGWTPEGAAIAIGNAQQESGIRADGRPGDPSTPGGSHYMFQWNNGKNNDTVNGRRAQYERFAAAHGHNPTDFYTSLDFMDEERKQRSGLERNWDRQTDLSNAGALSHAYEGFGDNSGGTRVANARRFLRMYQQTQNRQAAAAVAHDSQGNPVAVDASGHALNPDGTRTAASPYGAIAAFNPAASRPLGDTDALHQSILNQTKGDTHLTNAPVFNINGPDVSASMSAARLTASRGQQDLLRNIQGAEQ